MSRLSPLRATVATGLALGTAALGLAMAPAALAADAATPTAPSSVLAGEKFSVSGTGCFGDPTQQNYDPVVTLLTDGVTQNSDDVLFATAPAADGTWTAEVSFPIWTTAGAHVIEVNCDISYYNTQKDFFYPVVTLDVTAPPAGTILGTEANTAGVATKDTGSTTGASTALGEKVVKVLTGFQPYEVVTVTLHSTPVTVGTFTADAQGTVTVTFTLPAGTPVGNHTLVYDGDQGTYFQESIAVAAASPAAATTAAAASGGLAYTGASVALPLALGTGLLAAGGGALLITRRRSAGASQA
jgi:hypothetical protein